MIVKDKEKEGTNDYLVGSTSVLCIQSTHKDYRIGGMVEAKNMTPQQWFELGYADGYLGRFIDYKGNEDYRRGWDIARADLKKENSE